MDARLLKLPLALLLAFGVAAGASAQTRTGQDAATLPVWNSASGKVEAYLLLEPATGNRWRSGGTGPDAAFGLGAGDTLGLFCGKTGLSGAIGSLANHCIVASLDDAGRAPRQSGAGASITRGTTRLGMALGTARETLPAWLSPNNRAVKAEQNALTLYGQKNIGREATVSIGGTWAKARLVPASEMPAELNDRWSTRSISVGAGYGPFGANIIGRVVDTPGQPGQWEGLGLGLTWRTPWSGQLTVGAENVVTRGRNPFAPGNLDDEEGTVPYVRYEQDL